MFVYKYIRIYIYIYTHTYIHTYIHIYIYIYTYAYIRTYTCIHVYVYTYIDSLTDRYRYTYTRSPLEDPRLFGPSTWTILRHYLCTNGFLSNPAPGENLLSGNLVMETGCIHTPHTPATDDCHKPTPPQPPPVQ